jgi:catecholate siderophore receptor
VENLTGNRYFPTAHNDNNITTGAPLNARFTLSAKF